MAPSRQKSGLNLRWQWPGLSIFGLMPGVFTLRLKYWIWFDFVENFYGFQAQTALG